MFTLNPKKISAIPTTLITGFLGVGKTTAILQLLANKPEHENWAVLVNEFGEVGIDSAILSADKKASNEQGVFIREVPGGCMCCASGVPMQVALNQLIVKAKPDRLIIEPTGLGHPKEVIEVLTSNHYQSLISLESVLCLVDARNLNDERYTQHPSFIQQLKVSDTILAAKADKYSSEDEDNLAHFINRNNLTEKDFHLLHHGNINPSWITKNNGIKRTNEITQVRHVGVSAPSIKDRAHNSKISTKNQMERDQAKEDTLEKEGFIELNNKGEGYFSKGWIFTDKYIFNHQQFIALIRSLNVSRAKGVIQTNKGCYSFNKADDDFSCNKATDTKDSRIELIDTNQSALNNITTEQLLRLNVQI
jgi:G3E family GTPase